MFLTKKVQNLCGAIFLIAISNNVLAYADSVTQYQYDARGRLVKVSDNASKEINYTYDDAGNRIKVTDVSSAPAPDPVITSFVAPNTVPSVGAYATITWASTGASYCSLAIFGDSSSYPNLATSGSQSIRIYEDTGVTITCFSATKSASAGKIIRIASGGGGMNNN
jgi:YD repeat-containing protein